LTVTGEREALGRLSLVHPFGEIEDEGGDAATFDERVVLVVPLDEMVPGPVSLPGEDVLGDVEDLGSSVLYDDVVKVDVLGVEPSAASVSPGHLDIEDDLLGNRDALLEALVERETRLIAEDEMAVAPAEAGGEAFRRAEQGVGELFLVERLEGLRSEDLEHVCGKIGVGDDDSVGPGSDDPQGRGDPLDHHRGVAGEGVQLDPIDEYLNEVDDGRVGRAQSGPIAIADGNAGRKKGSRGLAPDLSR
jgi:hypothetical protein